MTVDYHHRDTTERQLQSVEFLGDSVAITYVTIPEDIRQVGLALTHTLLIPLDDNEYEEEFTTAYAAIQALLNDALEDHRNLEPYDPRESDENSSDGDDDE